MVLEKTKIKHAFSDAAKTYDSVASLQRQIGLDLLNSQALDHLQGVWLDLGCGTGFLTQEILKHGHHETLIALDLSQMMLEHCREKVGVKSHYICADAEKLPLKAQSVNAILSNVALQWCYPIDEALSELHRVLVGEGILLFSTFGSETLCELKATWATVDDFVHVNDFYTLENLHAALENAGFVDITLRRIRYLRQYTNVLELMHELKDIGAHNVNQTRSKTLTSKKTLKTLMSMYPKNEVGGIDATFDVIYVMARNVIC
ncbi:MAG: malonyl-[acyl-carrier protein] O-methyltransferase BioC [Pseudomonadota bacterium]|jgi:malonyl-CoA O-methyltransferase